MTKRQQKFAEYYAACGNVAQAALQAGYSEKYARSDACKILANPSVAAYLSAIGAADAKSRVISATKRQEILSDLATDDGIEPKDRIKAIDTLNKMTGEYVVRMDACVTHSPKLDAIMAQLGGRGLDSDD